VGHRVSRFASAYQAVGQLDEAIALYTQTLADAERELGRDNAKAIIPPER
jgi:hypothetical protein